MHALKTFFVVILSSIPFISSAQKKAVAHFDKVIVSPYIQATFVEGDEESVYIDHIKVDQGKLNIEVSNNTLHM